MRVVRSRWANVTKDGTEVHHQVRVLMDDQNRLAVFASKSSTLLAVYQMADVQLSLSKAPGCMCKEPSQHELARVWKQSERVHANGGSVFLRGERGPELVDLPPGTEVHR